MVGYQRLTPPSNTTYDTTQLPPDDVLKTSLCTTTSMREIVEPFAKKFYGKLAEKHCILQNGAFSRELYESQGPLPTKRQNGYLYALLDDEWKMEYVGLSNNINGDEERSRFAHWTKKLGREPKMLI